MVQLEKVPSFGHDLVMAELAPPPVRADSFLPKRLTPLRSVGLPPILSVVEFLHSVGVLAFVVIRTVACLGVCLTQLRFVLGRVLRQVLDREIRS